MLEIATPRRVFTSKRVAPAPERFAPVRVMGMSGMDEQLNQLYLSLRRETSAARREELVLVALRDGIAPTAIQEMLDHIEQCGCPKPHFLPSQTPERAASNTWRWLFGTLFNRVHP